MQITFANLAKSLGKELIKSASKCEVRECDETERGHFVAYVDEGKDTFDVTVEVNDEQQFVAHTCDCKSARKICQHTAALMLYIASRTETKSKTVKKVKFKESDSLADAAEPAAILAWLKQQFSANKELELAFINAFRTHNTQFDPETIRKSSIEAQKAVIGRLQKVDARLTTKLLALWSTIQDPVRQYYADHPTDQNAFNCYMEITDVLLGFRERYYINSPKFTSAFEDHLRLPVSVLTRIQDEDSWRTAISFYAKIAFVPFSATRMVAETLISGLFLFSPDRKKALTIALLEEMAGLRKDDKRDFSLLISLLLKMAVEQDLFNEYQDVFEPLNYSPHDDLLLKLLIENKNYARAVALVQPYATMDAYPAQQLRALETLKSIYIITGEEQQLIETLKALVPINYNFQDYQQLLQRLDGQEAKRITAPVLHKAISGMHIRRDLFDFSFKVFADAKEYDKMIRYLPKALSYEAIIPWFETLVVFDAEGTFKAMLTLSDLHFNQAARASVRTLVELTMELYPIEFLQTELSKLLSRYHVLAANTYVRALAERFEF